jgi:hypothetical protein
MNFLGRGIYADRFKKGYTVRVHKADGTVEERNVPAEDGTVVLALDVRKYFPDSKAVNIALRALIKRLPHKRSSSGES